MRVSVSARLDGEEWRPLSSVEALGDIVLGRASHCHIRVPGNDVSREHAKVRVTASGLSVEDASTNGTWVNSELVQGEGREVGDGACLRVGSLWVRFNPERSDIAPAVEPRGSVASTPQPPGPPEATGPSLSGVASEAAARGSSGGSGPPASHSGVSRRDTQGPSDSPGVGAPELRRQVHRLLLDHLDLGQASCAQLGDPSYRPRVLSALRRILESLGTQLDEAQLDELVGELADEALGLGPLERLLADPGVTEIMVVGADSVYVERGGRLELTGARFTDEDRVRAVIERILTPLGRRIDESSPLVDARLADGSRVNAIISPLAVTGPSITIRKFPERALKMADLQGFGSLDGGMARFLERSVRARKNIVVSGGTGSGKTTLLNVLSGAIPSSERIVTIEDAAELRLAQPHVVSLETKPANLEGKGEYSIRSLVKNALRMRPDRIVVGECRGAEALDMLQAMNTGHDGSLTTTHANSPREALRRLETLVLMAGMELPVSAIRQQLASSIDLIVQQARMSDGSRKVTEIAEVCGIDESGCLSLSPIFRFRRSGTGSDGRVLGSFKATGYLPSYLSELRVLGLIRPGEPVL